MQLTRLLFLLCLGMTLWGCPDNTGSGSGGGETPAGDSVITSGEVVSGETSGEVTGGSMSGPCFEDDNCPDDSYCDLGDSFEGTCVEGCREDACDGGRVCDLESRACVLPPCEDDSGCPEGTYCNESVCETGCRVDEACPDAFDEDGRAILCDPITRECVTHSPCCVAGGDNEICVPSTVSQCSEQGGQVIQGALLCDDDPCGQVCELDVDCRNLDAGGASFYCDPVDNRCREGCRENECEGDLVCDLETRRCSDLSCVSSDDCSTGQYCDPALLVCRTGCSEDSDCDPGFNCNPNNICVESCDPENDMCGEGRYCDEQAETCRDECVNHESCEVGAACDPVSRRCIPGLCRDDEPLGELTGEPNSTFDEATRLNLVPLGSDAEYASGRAEGRIICGADRDLYRVSLSQGERMRITLSHEAAGDLNLRVFDVDDTSATVAESSGVEIPEVIEFPGEAEIREASDYYIEVAGDLDEAARISYDLSVQTAPLGNACFFDPRESNEGDDESANATELVQGGVTRYDDGSICVGDEDWFKIALTTNDGLTVEVRTTIDAQPLAFDLYKETELAGIGGAANPAYSVTEGIERPDTNTRAYRLEVPLNEAGFDDDTWYIVVRGGENDSYANYQITAQHEASNDVCVDDVYEPNDGILGGVDVITQFNFPTDDLGLLAQGRDNRIQNASICTADIDYYCFDLTDGDQIEAWVISNDTIGNLQVSITDSEGGQVGNDGTHTVTGDPNFDIATFLGASAGRYCAVVDGLGNAQGSYELNIRRSVPAGGVCANDEGANRNDTAATATQLDDVSDGQGLRFEIRNGLICDPSIDRADWYVFPVAQDDSRICAMLEGFAHTDLGGLDLEVYEPPRGLGAPCNNGVCEEGQCIDGLCRIASVDSTYIYDFEMAAMSGSAVEQGDHYIRVIADGDRSEIPYDLRVTVTPRRDMCQQDWQEAGDPNDSNNRATQLGSGSVGLCDTWICDDGAGNYDEDWYRLTVPAQEDRTVIINFSEGSDGSLELFYFGETETSLEDDVFLVSTTPSYDYQCINVSGGSVGAELEFGVGTTFVRNDGDMRVDYSIRVVPTDLAANPDGECALFGANQFSACSMDDPGQTDNGFAQGCWPTVYLP